MWCHTELCCTHNFNHYILKQNKKSWEMKYFWIWKWNIMEHRQTPWDMYGLGCMQCQKDQSWKMGWMGHQNMERKRERKGKKLILVCDNSSQPLIGREGEGGTHNWGRDNTCRPDNVEIYERIALVFLLFLSLFSRTFTIGGDFCFTATATATATAAILQHW